MENVTYVCPGCGSGHLDVSDNGARCLDCNWYGTEKGLVAVHVPNFNSSIIVEGVDNLLKVAEEISRSYLSLLAQHASKEIGFCMIRSGLVRADRDGKFLAALIRAACLGAHKATLEEVERIANELDKKRSKLLQ